MLPGFNVQFPAGRPFNTTLPVASEQEGWLIVPNNGADGVTGCAFTTAFTENDEVQPNEFVTVKLYVPVATPGIIMLVPLPAMLPGFMIQFPAGKPLSSILPVANAQVGWVIANINGAAGVGFTATIAFPFIAVTHKVEAIVAVIVQVPAWF